MKILHLVCNSHLDPVWQWDWDEGAASALATFYSAANLLDEYDYVFCHNEVLLYQYIEKYDPILFSRIQDLVAKGKWKIMGGWYVQPDCLVPSGESFIRQCSLGREYFNDKFNAYPTTALNFDSFGHSKGLVEILSKCGYDSYIFCRPMPYCHMFEKKDLPHGPFIWEGFDGSKIKALRYEDETIYCSLPWKTKECILRKMKEYQDQDISIALWGVGNHGGENSKKDLEDIMEIMDEKKGEYRIIHSTLEDYFKDVHPTQKYSKQIICFMKSYSSVNAIKLAHDQLENALYSTEKICSVADLYGVYHYDKNVLKRAEEILCQIEFHDVLSGTAIKLGTDSSIRKAHMAIEMLKEEFFKAFTSLANELPRVTPNNDNFVVYNPYPYTYKGYVQCELLVIFNDNKPEEEFVFEIYDKNKNLIPYQCIKEESEIDFDRRKRLLFKVDVKPFSVASYEIKRFKRIKENFKKVFDHDFTYEDNFKKIKINGQTGLLDEFIVNGVNYLSGSAFQPISFDDNEDPWGWWLNKFSNFKAFSLDKKLYPGLHKVTLLEDGNMFSKVQSIFRKNSSSVIINYLIYKNVPYIDIDVNVVWNEPKKGLKLQVPVAGSSKWFAQTAFGQEQYSNNSLEYPTNRYVGNCLGDNALSIYNRSGIHSASKKNNKITLTLFNGAAYCAHPVRPLGEKIIPDEAKITPFIELGEHEYHLRMAVNKIEECEKVSNEFNQPPYSLLYFPHGEGKCYQNAINLSNDNIVISALKRLNDGRYLIRLYNGTPNRCNALLSMMGKSIELAFKKYEFITLSFDGKKINLEKDSSIY